MDLNYLLQREQTERMRAQQAECDEARAAHLSLAEHYRAMVDTQRRRQQAAVVLKAELRQSRL